MVSPFSLSTGNELELRTTLTSLPAEHQGSEATEQPMSVWSKAFFLRLNNETPNPKNRVNTPAEISPRNIPQIFPPKYPVCYLEASQLWSINAVTAFSACLPFLTSTFCEIGQLQHLYMKHTPEFMKNAHTYHTHLILNQSCEVDEKEL